MKGCYRVYIMDNNQSTIDVPTDHSFASTLLDWFTHIKRDLPWRKTDDPYAIWVSEVMLQQTQVKTVIPYYERFLERFPGVQLLAAANLEDVLTVWRGLGYYSRARRMWEGAQYILEQWDGKMPRSYDDLLLVPGIGKYTAGAVASIAYGQSVLAIDGNVLRVVSRLIAWAEPVEAIRSYREFSNFLKIRQPADQAGDFNQALMELGAIVCTPTKPDCEKCPLSFVCRGNQLESVHLYPVKKVKAKRQVLTRLTFVLRKGDRVYLQRRPSKGLLANMWEFPGVELSQEISLEKQIPYFDREEGLKLFQQAVPIRMFDREVVKQFEQELTLHGPVWYTFSHRQWEIFWVVVDLSEGLDQRINEINGSIGSIGQVDNVAENSMEYSVGHEFLDDTCWVSLQDMNDIPLPVAFRDIIRELQKD